jgi:hypothetical protein
MEPSPSSRPRVTATLPPDAKALLHQGQRLADDAMALLDNTTRTANNARAWARGMVETRPYVSLAAAALVGYVVAGGLTNRLTRFAAITGGRVLGARLVTLLYGALSGPEGGAT